MEPEKDVGMNSFLVKNSFRSLMQNNQLSPTITQKAEV